MWSTGTILKLECSGSYGAFWSLKILKS